SDWGHQETDDIRYGDQSGQSAPGRGFVSHAGLLPAPAEKSSQSQAEKIAAQHGRETGRKRAAGKAEQPGPNDFVGERDETGCRRQHEGQGKGKTYFSRSFHTRKTEAAQMRFKSAAIWLELVSPKWRSRKKPARNAPQPPPRVLTK